MPFDSSYASSKPTDSFTTFLQEAGRVPLLTHEEEIMLARTVQEWMKIRFVDAGEDAELKRRQRRGERAYRRFFTANIRMVVTVARNYVPVARELTIDDLVMEGMSGLARAIELFDPARGYKFSTYAFNWIRQSVTRAISHFDRSIRIPVNGIESLSKLSKFVPVFKAENGRIPTFSEMAAHVGCQPDTLKGYLSHAQRVTSLSKPTGDDGHGAESTLTDLIPDNSEGMEEGLHRDELRREVDAVLDELDYSSAHVLRQYFGFDSSEMNLSEIASDWGMSRSAVGERKDSAIRQLRQTLLPAWKQMNS